MGPRERLRCAKQVVDGAARAVVRAAQARRPRMAAERVQAAGGVRRLLSRAALCSASQPRRTNERVMHETKLPRWDVALNWWRWAGHAARLAERQPEQWIAEALTWRDAMYREATKRR